VDVHSKKNWWNDAGGRVQSLGGIRKSWIRIEKLCPRVRSMQLDHGPGHDCKRDQTKQYDSEMGKGESQFTQNTFDTFQRYSSLAVQWCGVHLLVRGAGRTRTLGLHGTILPQQRNRSKTINKNDSGIQRAKGAEK
jgi:hypothetical protein